MDIHGNVTMDALMMEGTNLTAGAVACVKNLANPVTLARMVMEKVRFFYSQISIFKIQN